MSKINKRIGRREADGGDCHCGGVVRSGSAAGMIMIKRFEETREQD